MVDTKIKLLELLQSDDCPLILCYGGMERLVNYMIANDVRLEEKQATSNASEQFATDNSVGDKMTPAAYNLSATAKWIPVTERLPQEDLPVGAVCDVVQVLLQNGTVTVGWCNRGLKCWYYLPIEETRFVGHGYDLTPVVAWKPLSEPPKETIP